MYKQRWESEQHQVQTNQIQSILFILSFTDSEKEIQINQGILEKCSFMAD